ncbi:MAG: immunoglobulin-like domain-containing protein [Chryseolinea sp.]
MKFNSYKILVFVALVALAGCERDLETEGLSRITYYPVFKMEGEQWNTIAVGGTFTDPGMTATEGEQEIEVQVSGDAVDVNTPGVYTIEYTATNKDDYSVTDYRYVGVIDPTAAATDLTGQYKRTAGAQGVATITKLAPGFYYSDNVGGTAAAGVGVHFYHYEGNKLGVPVQLVGGSAFYCTDATVEVGVKYSWVVMNSGFGTALRVFVKL